MKLWPLAVAWCLAAVAASSTVGTSSAPSQADSLAAESLRHSAVELTVASPDVPARAGRLVAIARMAERLQPGDPRTGLLLANIYETQGKAAQAAESLKLCLDAAGEDHSLAVRWLVTKLAGMDNAEQRIAFLESVLAGKAFSRALQAEAAVELAEIFARQGRKKAQVAAFKRALKLAPDQPVALRGLMAQEGAARPAEQVARLLGLLRGNPLAVNVAWELAGLLDSLGLYDQSVEMFDYAWSVHANTSGGRTGSSLFVWQYLSAMLDAGLAARAVEKFQPLLAKFPGDMSLRGLMVEAYRACGQEDEADKLVDEIHQYHRRRILATGPSEELLAEMAWFYTVVKPNPKMAREYARRVNAETEDPVIQRIIGAAELFTGDVARARRRLEKLQHKDVYASALLAERLFSLGQVRSAAQAVAAGAAVTQGGPGFRKLKAVAEEQGLTISPLAGSAQACEVLERFDRRYLQMGLAPERFLAVEIAPAAGRLMPGEPVMIVAELRNKGSLPVPIGDWGLISPAMALKVTIAGQDVAFEDLPLAIWPCPRQLAGGQSVKCTVRLDVGKLADFLMPRPLDELLLVVSGLLDPAQRGREFRSSVPSVEPRGCRIKRAGLLGDVDRSDAESLAPAYQLALGRIVRDLRHADLPTRMAAARKTACLLAFVDRLERREAKWPPGLRQAVKRPVLLSILRAMLSDPSPAVRAEMLAALGRVRLDASILTLSSGLIEDPSPLVRFRMAELIGTSGSAGKRAVLDHFAADPDKLVAAMSAAFGPARPAKRGGPDRME